MVEHRQTISNGNVIKCGTVRTIDFSGVFSFFFLLFLLIWERRNLRFNGMMMSMTMRASIEGLER